MREIMRHPLLGIVETLLREDRPPPLMQQSADSRPSAGPLPTSPLGKAIRGFGLAVEAVVDSDDAVVSADWERRQNTLRRWRDQMQSDAPIDPAADVAARIVRGEKVDLGEEIAPRWKEMLTDLQEAMLWASRRSAETERKAKALFDGHKRCETIERRAKERMAEIVYAAEARIAERPEEDVAGRQALIAEAQQEVRVVSETAIQRVSVQTRHILDLDDNTAAISVGEWLARHLLDP